MYCLKVNMFLLLKRQTAFCTSLQSATLVGYKRVRISFARVMKIQLTASTFEYKSANVTVFS